jgi:hypothetical protein
VPASGQTTLSNGQRVDIERRYADIALRAHSAARAAHELVRMPSRSALITRKQLRVDEEARAVEAMLDRGYTEDGAAQALGWPEARVTARVKMLALPDRAIELVGAGRSRSAPLTRCWRSDVPRRRCLTP